MSIRRRQDHPACIRKDLNKCSAPCDGTVGVAGYTSAVAAATANFADPSAVLAHIRHCMDERAAAHRFEDASVLRDTLHRLAFALHRMRQLQAVLHAGRLVARRDLTHGCETILVCDGMLHATATHPSPLDDMDVNGWADTQPSSPPCESALPEETLLIAGWLNDPSVRLISATGQLAWPINGGRYLTDTWREAKELRRNEDRAVRRADVGAATPH